MDIIQGGQYDKMQILTHPFWYHENEKNIKEILDSFVKIACVERYDNLDENFTNLDEIMDRREIGL